MGLRCGTSPMIETPNRLRSTAAEGSQLVLVVKNLPIKKKNRPASVEGIRVVGLIPGSGISLEEYPMATHSSILAWRVPWIDEPGGLQSIGLQRVGHN